MAEVKQITLSKEILRFLVTGIVCTLVDFLVTKLFLFICQGAGSTWSQIISVTMGFIVSLVVNYFLSTYWVFAGKKDKKECKTPLFLVLFTVFSLIGLGISLGVMALAQVICYNAWGIDISKSDILEMFTTNFFVSATFWAFFVSFCIKTIASLVWNYLTRKYILYRNK